MPTFDAGISGLTGTVGCTILDSAGSVHVAHTTAGITEPVAGSGVYSIAEHDAAATLTYVWNTGAGAISGSETLYAGRGDDAAILLALKLLRNKVVTNPTTGVMTVYDDNGTTPLYTANVYEDIAGTMPFDGTGANRRDRLA